MFLIRLVIAFVLGLSLLPLPDTAFAAEGMSPAEVQQRKINLAGKQRMLSQQILMFGCMASYGVHHDTTTTSAQAAIAEFDHVLGALRKGDEELGLPLERNATVLKALAKVEHLWPRFRGTAQALIEGAPEELGPLREMAPDLLTHMNAAVQEMVADSNAGGVPELKRAIDVAGRQRMLIMKMTAEVCLVKSGLSPDVDLSRASKTMNLFDTALYDLQYGNIGDDVIEAPSWEIAEMLKLVEAQWDVMRGDIEAVLMSPNPTVEEMDAMMKTAIQLLTDMNETVWMYENIRTCGLT